VHPDRAGELLLWMAEWKAGRDEARHIAVNTATLPDLLIQGNLWASRSVPREAEPAF
jgi:hypothetical protein